MTIQNKASANWLINMLFVPMVFAVGAYMVTKIDRIAESVQNIQVQNADINARLKSLEDKP